MSRSESSSTYDTATATAATDQEQSQASYKQAQDEVSAYKDSLAKFSAANPYGEGGEDQSATNQVTANTADSTARAYGNMLQQQAQRTGENVAGANASAEAIAQQSQRDLSATQAGAVADRVKNKAAYDQASLAADTVPIQAEAGLSAEQGQLSSGAQSTAASAAAANKSFWDSFGTAFATGLGGTLSGANAKSSGGASGLGMLM